MWGIVTAWKLLCSGDNSMSECASSRLNEAGAKNGAQYAHSWRRSTAFALNACYLWAGWAPQLVEGLLLSSPEMPTGVDPGLALKHWSSSSSLNDVLVALEVGSYTGLPGSSCGLKKKKQSLTSHFPALAHATYCFFPSTGFHMLVKVRIVRRPASEARAMLSSRAANMSSSYCPGATWSTSGRSEPCAKNLRARVACVLDRRSPKCARQVSDGLLMRCLGRARRRLCLRVVNPASLARRRASSIRVLLFRLSSTTCAQRSLREATCLRETGSVRGR